MKKLLGLFALLLASSAAAQSYGGYPDYGYDGQRFTCESVNGRQNYCRVDTRGGVQLVRQLSKSPCVRGSTWNYDRGGVWVSQGCRAQFASGYDNGNGYGYGGGYGNGQTIRCESIDNRTRECPANTRGGVRLVRKLSKSPCEEGRNWGYHRDRVWVSGGCRAEFAIGKGGSGYPGYGDDYYGGGYGGQTLRCESIDNRTRECPANTRGDVRLVRKLSKSPCEEGRNWGYHRDRVWVSGGCRAEFAIGQGGGGWNGYSDYGDSGYGYGNGRTLRCESIDARQRECRVDVRRDVRLVRNLSKARCVEGRNWGWDRYGIWVADGCRAEFLVD